MPTKEQEIQALVTQIIAAKKAYYDGTPTMTDDEYDALENRLEELDPDNPTLKITGAPASGIWQKKKHEIPMPSLHKVKGVQGLHEWWEKTAAILQS